jgi:metallo-beta-lactamase family protein
MGVTITFLGGAGTVTGSKYLVRHDGPAVLVDCGLFQGYKQLRLRNWSRCPWCPPHRRGPADPCPPGPQRLPAPAGARGFRGMVFATRRHARPVRHPVARQRPPAGRRCRLFANRHGFSKHAPALPLYTRQDALGLPEADPHRCRWIDLSSPCRLAGDASPAGHILGAASLLLEVGRRASCSRATWAAGRPALMNPPDHRPQPTPC